MDRFYIVENGNEYSIVDGRGGEVVDSESAWCLSEIGETFAGRKNRLDAQKERLKKMNEAVTQ